MEGRLIKKLKKRIKTKKRGFTLIELIVTITILVILSFISYIYFSWLIKSGRDASRSENINRIKTALELYSVKSWVFPEPTNPIDITYSWATIWKQWTFWDSVFTNVWELNKKPTDILTNTEFAYSITKNKKEYELWTVIEWSSISHINIINKTYAAWNTTAISLTKWNYNWVSIYTSTWWVDYILAIPSIISYDTNETDIEKLTNRQTLSYNWYFNLPASYSWTIFKVDWWFNFKPNILQVYIWNIRDLQNDWQKIVNFIKNLQHAYSWTILESKEEIKKILSINTDNIDTDKNIWQLVKELVKRFSGVDIDDKVSFVDINNWNNPWNWNEQGWNEENWGSENLTFNGNYLLSKEVRSIFQDENNNNLWFATKNWVSMFDWTNWLSYDESDWISDKDVRDITKDSSGSIWIATKRWISVFSWGSWISYDIWNSSNATAIIEYSGDKWVTTNKWVKVFDWTNWLSYDEWDWLADKDTKDIIKTSSWDIWVATKKWVSKFDGIDSWISYDDSDWLADKDVLKVYETNDTTIWAWTMNWISTFDWTNWSYYNWSDQIINKKVQNIFEDSNWNMWFSTFQWASMFDWNNWINYDDSDWIADKDIQIVFEDIDWNIWFWTKSWVSLFNK